MDEVKVVGKIYYGEDDYVNFWSEVEDDETRENLSDILYKKIPEGTKVEVIVRVIE